GLQHVAGEARVLADDDAVTIIGLRLEDLAGGHADLQRDLRSHWRPVGETANTVGTEIAARHRCPLGFAVRLLPTIPRLRLHRLTSRIRASERAGTRRICFAVRRVAEPNQIL